MLNGTRRLAEAFNLNSKTTRVFQKRAQVAREHCANRIKEASEQHLGELTSKPLSPWDFWNGLYAYSSDCAQRSILFWETLRQRGNQYLEHERAGKPPVLHFEYGMIVDARQFKRPVNYALLRIVPPKGVKVDPNRRPYVIIDPRAGHGPGIGGFKDDSQVGVALREGHPVYFVTFFPEPEPGQTLLDVMAAEQQFIQKVRQLHPKSPKPVLVGNCQGGWAAMMLAASDPEDTGAIVINGAPMSYWGGAWSEGEGDNPMRYAAGLQGGTWLASLVSDLGNGVFDGAWLVQNFEGLNPANTFWDKYYHLFANIDTEPPRFLEFERWWGGYFLMNRDEIEWITRNLFVGNKLWTGEVRAGRGRAFDLREIRAPIILFASLGDNITPPQQAFNWVADIYGSTEEIEAMGQVIVGLLHRNIGHLGIFVSGKVAKREHTQIVSVLKSIEALPPGLYGMQILDHKGADGKVEYEVQFEEHRLEEVVARLNRFKRADEKPFEVVQKTADFNQHAYELFVRPWVQAVTNEQTAQWLRTFHPLRIQHWALSDLNPWLAWLGPVAASVKANRTPTPKDAPATRIERMMSEVFSTALDYYRELRDAASEALFYQLYGNPFTLSADGEDRPQAEESATDSADNPFLKKALAAMTEGGYPEAVARVFSLLASGGASFPLAQLHLKRELAVKFKDLLPKTTPEQQRRIRGVQDSIVRYSPELALSTLPQLLTRQADRARLSRLLDRVMSDQGMQQLKVTPVQLEMLRRIREVLGAGTAPRARSKVKLSVLPSPQTSLKPLRRKLCLQ